MHPVCMCLFRLSHITTLWPVSVSENTHAAQQTPLIYLPQSSTANADRSADIQDSPSVNHHNHVKSRSNHVALLDIEDGLSLMHRRPVKALPEISTSSNIISSTVMRTRELYKRFPIRPPSCATDLQHLRAVGRCLWCDGRQSSLQSRSLPRLGGEFARIFSYKRSPRH